MWMELMGVGIATLITLCGVLAGAVVGMAIGKLLMCLLGFTEGPTEP